IRIGKVQEGLQIKYIYYSDTLEKILAYMMKKSDNQSAENIFLSDFYLCFSFFLLAPSAQHAVLLQYLIYSTINSEVQWEQRVALIGI
ncbi:unnamed protein product, partial [marine sediment metagenome]